MSKQNIPETNNNAIRENNLIHDTFQMAPDEPDLPFAQIPNEILRSTTLSMGCMWLLSYLLSHKHGWVIKFPQIIKHMKGRIGRDCIYAIRKEAIEAGYIYCHEYFDKGLKRTIYYLSRTPRFKKFLRCPENQDTENPHNKEDYKKEDYPKNPPPSSSKSKPQKIKPKPELLPKKEDPLRGEEEDFLNVFNKTAIIQDLPISPKNQLRLLKWSLDKLYEAVEIFKTLEVKKDAMGLMLDILRNPEKYEKKEKIKTQQEKDLELEQYINENRKASKILEPLYDWKEYRAWEDFVEVKGMGGKVTISYKDRDFERKLNFLLKDLKEK